MKSKNKLLVDVIDFYNKEAKPLLEKYEEERKEDILPAMLTKICLWTMVLSFIATFMGIHIAIIPCFISIIILIIYCYFSQNKKIKKVKFGNSTSISINIPDDYEMILKKELMPKFLNLFKEGFKWCKYANPTKQILYDKLEIFPRGIYLVDDVMQNDSLEVPTKIIETKSGILSAGIGGVLSVFVTSFIIIIPILILVGIISFLGCTLVSNIFRDSNGDLSGFGAVTFFLLMLLPFLSPFFIWIILGIKCIKHSKQLVLNYKIPKEIKCHTIIVEKGYRAKFKNKNLKKIQLEDVVFHSKYDVYSDNEIECRYLLTTSFIEKFENIKTSFKSKRIRAEFKDNELSILIGVNKDLFKMGGLTVETTFKHFETMCYEIHSVLLLSEHLGLSKNTGL